MKQAIKTFFNWSSGKDAALALHHLRQDSAYQIELLLTTVNSAHNRVSMHGVRRELLEQQVLATGLPGAVLELPATPSGEEYAELMGKQVAGLKAAGFGAAAFGDIFLEDLRAYREQKLAPLGLEVVFPLWKKDTRELLHEFLDLGFKAITVCVQDGLLDASFAGRLLDKDFISDLPATVDPCGENGEFHTFCFDGPVFQWPVGFSKGEVVYREYLHGDLRSGFWFCDLLPQKATPPAAAV